MTRYKNKGVIININKHSQIWKVMCFSGAIHCHHHQHHFHYDHNNFAIIFNIIAHSYFSILFPFQFFYAVTSKIEPPINGHHRDQKKCPLIKESWLFTEG